MEVVATTWLDNWLAHSSEVESSRTVVVAAAAAQGTSSDSSLDRCSAAESRAMEDSRLATAARVTDQAVRVAVSAVLLEASLEVRTTSPPAEATMATATTPPQAAPTPAAPRRRPTNPRKVPTAATPISTTTHPRLQVNTASTAVNITNPSKDNTEATIKQATVAPRHPRAMAGTAVTISTAGSLHRVGTRAVQATASKRAMEALAMRRSTSNSPRMAVLLHIKHPMVDRRTMITTSIISIMHRHHRATASTMAMGDRRSRVGRCEYASFPLMG